MPGDDDPGRSPCWRPGRGPTAGIRLTGIYCSQCHGIGSPSRHSARDWRVVARRMFRLMEHMASMRGMMGARMHGDLRAPDAAEQTMIVAYLQEHALPETDEADLPEAEGRDLFVEVCSRCHALPDPGQHTAEEWPSVVERMRANMRRTEIAEADDGEATEIARYLREASPTGTGSARPDSS